MSQIVARYNQSPSENRRYLVDYTLDLAYGESLVSASVSITSPSGELIPALVVNNVALAPAVGGQITQLTYFALAGTSGQTYEVELLVTTTLGQIFDSVIAYAIAVKT